MHQPLFPAILLRRYRSVPTCHAPITVFWEAGVAGYVKTNDAQIPVAGVLVEWKILQDDGDPSSAVLLRGNVTTKQDGTFFIHVADPGGKLDQRATADTERVLVEFEVSKKEPTPHTFLCQGGREKCAGYDAAGKPFAPAAWKVYATYGTLNQRWGCCTLASILCLRHCASNRQGTYLENTACCISSPLACVAAWRRCVHGAR